MNTVVVTILVMDLLPDVFPICFPLTPRQCVLDCFGETRVLRNFGKANCDNLLNVINHKGSSEHGSDKHLAIDAIFFMRYRGIEKC